MKFANIFQKLNFSGKFFSPMMMANRRWLGGRKYGYGYKAKKRDCAGVYENK